jgi:Right handed beta helix region
MSRNTVGFRWWGRAGAGVGASARSRRVNRRRLRPGLLELEERRLLATFTVTNTAGSGAGSLPFELSMANSNGQANTVVFGPVFSTPQTITLENGNQLDMSNVKGTQTIIGPAAGVTINAAGNSRVFEVHAGVTASISALTITGGGGTADRGGGLLNFGNLTLTNCTVTGNTASRNSSGLLGNGGGVANYGTVTLADCKISGNTAANNGGALFNNGTATLTDCGVGGGNTAGNSGGAVFNSGTVTLSSSDLNNDSASGYGGGLYNASGTATLTNCTAISDAAGASYYGGGVYNNATLNLANSTLSLDTAGRHGGGLYNASGTATLTNCTVSNDTAGYGGGNWYGGGVYNNATLNLTDSTLSNDRAGGHGGGLYNASGTATLTNCTVSNDGAGGGGAWYGGGLYNNATLNLASSTLSDDSAGGYGGGLYNNATATLTNSTFSGDSAGSGYYGGALYNNSNATLVSCTFSNNTASFGGGLYNNSKVSLTNTIVAGNTARATNGGPDVFGSATSLGNNLIGNTQGSSGWGGSDLTNTNAQLAPLGFYGGPTQTMALKTGSPAIHKGIAKGVSSDQRGFPLDSPPDIGAFQVQSGPLAWQVNTTADGSDVPSGKLDLRAAVDLANVLSGGHTITFAPSVFATAQTITLTSGQLELSNTGGTLTITGPAAGVKVSGGGLNRVFELDRGVTASIYALTITGGGGNVDRGGGLLVDDQANLTLTNCTVTGNAASTNGGGLANYGTVNLNNCTISGNTASKNGGGLFTYDLNVSAKATLTNCTITGNNARGDLGGGGLFFSGGDSGSALNLTGCTISNNSANEAGGGLWFYGGYHGINVTTLTNCTVTGNAATVGAGVDNTAGVVALTNCTVSANLAVQGGGGLMNDNVKSTTNLTNCTVTGNSANGGGGLYNRGTVSVTSCTIIGNSGKAKGGGGLFNLSSPATLTDTIVARNSAGSTPPTANDIAGGISVSGTFNLIGTGGSGGLANGVSGNIVGVADPGLAQLDFYGGSTQTMALLPGSMAIGAGTTVSGVTTDQRGLPLDSPPDIGAFQVQSGPLAWQVNTTADGAPGKLDLRGAVNLADILPGEHTITFSPTVFATAQTIALKPGQLELSNTGGPQSITGPAAGVTISGGGMNRVFQVDPGVTASMSELTITGGGGTADRGGGLLGLGNVTLTNCTLTGNTASKTGGGIASYASLTMTNCTVSSNMAPSGNGGGIANLAMATLTNCAVSSNSAANGGGLLNNGTMSMTNCTVSGNKVGVNGGGLANYGTVTLTNCTVSNNSATNGGGLLGAGTMALTSCTVSGNSASSGGGVENRSGSATLTDTIIARNTNTSRPSGPSDIAGASNVTGSFNLIGNGGSGGLTNGVNGNIVGVTDPDLSSLGPYGGPTQTMALLPGSPAIGKGTPVSGVTTDQRGLARGAFVDIGAFQYSLVVESTAGPVNADPAQLTLAGAVSLADALAGPIAISFDPAVFTGGQTITLTGSQLELSKPVPIFTITGPAAGVTISGGGLSRVFQIDKSVTAYISGLTISDGPGAYGASLEDLGSATLTNCIFSGVAPSSAGAIAVSGGTLELSDCTITGWLTGIQVVSNAIAKITDSAISGNDTGILVGSSSTDSCAVTVNKDDLSDDTVGVKNNTSRPVDATLNWWGSSNGPGGTGAATAVGNVNFSPWFGDAGSLELATPDSLGFASAAGNSYVVTPFANGPSLQITLAGHPNPPWTVTPRGTVIFVGSGGVVTVSGQPGTDAFTITNAAVTFTVADVFDGATIQFNGNIGRGIDAKGTKNSFDVSDYTGDAILTAPIAAGTVSTMVATKSAGYAMNNSTLSSTDGMHLKFRGITTANLTAMTTSGNPAVIVDASAFAGVTNLTAGGTGDAILFGGGSTGNQGGTLMATGSGNDVLIGGPGANTLTDIGTGKSILIGGGGPNTITGNGNDILISGTTTYDVNNDANIAALDAILAEWSSTDSYAVRISKISSGMITGGYALNASTVKSNGKVNTVRDGLQPNQENWFIITRNDVVTAKGTETQTTIPA